MFIISDHPDRRFAFNLHKTVSVKLTRATLQDGTDEWDVEILYQTRETFRAQSLFRSSNRDEAQECIDSIIRTIETHQANEKAP